MRWCALQKGRVYVKQNQHGSQLTVADVQNMFKSDTHMADCVIRYGEGLRGHASHYL